MRHCPAEPGWAGSVTFPGLGRYAAFACDEHCPVLDEPQPITPGDRYDVELERRRAHLHHAWADRPRG